MNHKRCENMESIGTKSDAALRLKLHEMFGLALTLSLILTVSAKSYSNHQIELSGPNSIRNLSTKPEQALLKYEIGMDDATAADWILNESANEEDSKQEEESPPPYHTIILQAADQHDMDPALICAVIMVESSYNPNAISKSGARGLMQLMPRTAKALGVKDSLNPEHNINGGVKYLRQLLDRFDGDVTLALAAYNAGSRYVKKYKGIPPFRETRNFVKKVLTYYEAYRKQINSNEDNMA